MAVFDRIVGHNRYAVANRLHRESCAYRSAVAKSPVLLSARYALKASLSESVPRTVS